MSTSHRAERETVETLLMPRAFAGLIAAAARLDLRVSAPEDIAALLRGADFDDASLAPFIHFVPGRYARNCVYRDERFELLILCWPRGSRSPIHDHGGSRCFVSVLRGALTVENFAILENGRAAGHARLEHTGTGILQRAAIDARGPDRDVHRVSAPDGVAVSLHLYAKPLDACLVFDVTKQTCQVAVSRYDRPPLMSERVRSMAVVASSARASTRAGRAPK